MTDQSSQSMREWLDLIVEACSSLPGQTKEELRSELEAAGVNVDRLLRGVRDIMDNARAALRRAKFAEAAQERELALSQLDAVRSNYGGRAALQQRLYYLLDQTGASAQFRGLEELTDDDMSQMIAELEFLHRKETNDSE